MKSFKSGFSLVCLGILALTVVASMVFATACGGGSVPVNPSGQNTGSGGNGTTPPPSDGGSGDGTTPPPSGGGTTTPPPDSTESAVQGSIDVGGIPVSDTGGLPADITRVTLKVIDPSEEIGDVPTTSPSAAGAYAIGGLAPATIRYLNVSFNTSVDLKGLGQTVTPVSINFPIRLAGGVTTKVNTSVAVFAPKAAASVRAASKDGDEDDEGDDDGGGDDDEDYGSIEITYSYDGPDGVRSGRFIIDYRLNQTVYDLDDDGAYDDEIGHDDGDNDGIGDDRLNDDQHSDEFVEVESEGPVQDIGNDFIKVNGVLFIVDERTNFKDGQALSTIAIGDSVKVKGYTTPSGNTYAEEIELEDEDGSGEDG